MTLSSKIYINMEDGKVKDRIVERAGVLSVWVRFYSDGDKVNDMCASVTDHECAGQKKNTTIIVETLDEMESAIKAGFRHTAFESSVLSSDLECDKLFTVRDAVGYVPPAQYRSLYSAAGVYRNKEFLYDFADSTVTSRVTHKGCYITEAQMYYLYMLLVKEDTKFNKGMGTRLRRTFGEGITSSEGLTKYSSVKGEENG